MKDTRSAVEIGERFPHAAAQLVDELALGMSFDFAGL